MGEWLSLSQIARYWGVSEEEARSIVIERKKLRPKPSGEIYVDEAWLDRIAAELKAKAESK